MVEFGFSVKVPLKNTTSSTLKRFIRYNEFKKIVISNANRFIGFIIKKNSRFFKIRFSIDICLIIFFTIYFRC